MYVCMRLWCVCDLCLCVCVVLLVNVQVLAPVHLDVEARGKCLVSSSVSASPCSFKKGLSLKQKLATLTKLAG